jgi:hypothetical protein
MFNGAVASRPGRVTWVSYRKDFVCVKLKHNKFYGEYNGLADKFCLYPVFTVGEGSFESQLLSVMGFLKDKSDKTHVWLECPDYKYSSVYVENTKSILLGFKGTAVKVGVKCDVYNSSHFSGVPLWVTDFDRFSVVSNVVFMGDGLDVQAFKIV